MVSPAVVTALTAWIHLMGTSNHIEPMAAQADLKQVDQDDPMDWLLHQTILSHTIVCCMAATLAAHLANPKRTPKPREVWVKPRDQSWWADFANCVYDDQQWKRNFRITRQGLGLF